MRPAVVLGGLTVYGLGVYSYVLYSTLSKDFEKCLSIDKRKRLQLFDRNANSYDRDIQWDETLMGISYLRKCLMKEAKGRVLEVCAGTGRNLKYYPKQTDLTIVDGSAGMLSNINTDGCKGMKYRYKKMDAEALAFEKDTFDTVVDTFGLCSVEDPQVVVNEMIRVCKPKGVLLFLEHGKSLKYDWMNRILNRFVDQHEAKWGCTWNRDILNIIQSKATCDQVHVYHFGTTYYIIARVNNPTQAGRKISNDCKTIE